MNMVGRCLLRFSKRSSFYYPLLFVSQALSLSLSAPEGKIIFLVSKKVPAKERSSKVYYQASPYRVGWIIFIQKPASYTLVSIGWARILTFSRGIRSCLNRRPNHFQLFFSDIQPLKHHPWCEQICCHLWTWTGPSARNLSIGRPLMIVLYTRPGLSLSFLGPFSCAISAAQDASMKNVLRTSCVTYTLERLKWGWSGITKLVYGISPFW